RHAHRVNRSNARPAGDRRLRKRPGVDGPGAPRGRPGGRACLGTSHLGGLRRIDRERDRRHQEFNGPVGRGDDGGALPARVRGWTALGAPRYRGQRLAGRAGVEDGAQGTDRIRGARDGAPGAAACRWLTLALWLPSTNWPTVTWIDRRSGTRSLRPRAASSATTPR